MPKVYSCPAEVPEPKPDYRNYNRGVEQKKEDDHKAALKAWLTAQGYKGEMTGRIYSTHVADGQAQYMLGDKGARGSILIHLPYGDAYHSRDVEFIPYAELVSRIKRYDSIPAMFGKG